MPRDPGRYGSRLAGRRRLELSLAACRPPSTHQPHPLAAPLPPSLPCSYVVWFVTTVACSASVYTMTHFLRDSPDVMWNSELRQDGCAETQAAAARGEAHKHSFFRFLGESRNRAGSFGLAW